MRFVGEGVMTSSGVKHLRLQANGFSAATRLKADHSLAMRSRWASIVSPRAKRIAFSNSGYAWTGIWTPIARSAPFVMFSSVPKTSSGVPSSLTLDASFRPASRRRLRE